MAGLSTMSRITFLVSLLSTLILNFQISSAQAGSPDTTKIIKKFDWRAVHGANVPPKNTSIPTYYDGDPGGSGWMTPTDVQACNQCWAFSAVHATEALVNLYYNRHLDLELSEQEVASCSGGNASYDCQNGGSVYRKRGGSALGYIIDNGVSEEDCFPYVGEFPECSEKCANPELNIRIAGVTALTFNYDEVKLALIKHGPFVGCVDSEITGEDLGHCVVTVGFDENPVTGEIIWIYKNSYGDNYQERIDYGPGYGGLPVPLEYVNNLYSLNTPIYSNNVYKIACNDKDGDGFYNWGISKEMPETCPQGIPSTKDCDDSNPNRVFRNRNGHCLKTCSTQSDCDDDDECTTDTCTDLGCEYQRIPGCGDCLSVEGTLAELEKSGHLYKGEYGPYEDCSACSFYCLFPWGCKKTVDHYYHALGSGEKVGFSSEAKVKLYSIEHSFVWSTTECKQSPTCDNVNCDDGDDCNGIEYCEAGLCYPGKPIVCDDGNSCNGTEYCEDGLCYPGESLICDDGKFCNGQETCDADFGCQAGKKACANNQTCDETNDLCIDAHCGVARSWCRNDADCCSSDCKVMLFGFGFCR